jgi:hypothetical protein
LHISIIGITHGKSDTKLGEASLDVSKYYNKVSHKLDLAINHPAFQLMCKISIVDLTKGIDHNVDVQAVLKNEKMQTMSQEDAMRIRANSLVFHEKKKQSEQARHQTKHVDVSIEVTKDSHHHDPHHGKDTKVVIEKDVHVVIEKEHKKSLKHTTIEVHKTKSGQDAYARLERQIKDL